MSRTGRCLCGAVSFEAVPLGMLNACHCETCQKWGGGPFMAVPCRKVRFTGEVREFASSDIGTRGFCPACGTHLYFRPGSGNVWGVPLGLLDDKDGLTFGMQFFTDEKPPHYDFANATERLTGADFNARFRAGRGE